VRRARQRRYVHGRPSAHKRTGGRKVYDFIGRVGQLSLRQFDAAAYIIIIIVCVCVLYICLLYTASAALTQSGIAGRIVVVTAWYTYNTYLYSVRGPGYNKIIIIIITSTMTMTMIIYISRCYRIRCPPNNDVYEFK